MVNLFTTYYTDPERGEELYDVQNRNIMNVGIDRIFLLSEIHLDLVVPKVSYRLIDSRPTFAQIFAWVNSVTGEQDVNIIANSDIYFTEMAIEYMKVALFPADCWALTRWDGDVFMNRRDSNDCFVFRGDVRPIVSDFEIGIGGCDNRLCYEIQQAGYNITNPSWTVRTQHLHKNEERTWYGKPQVPPPYLLINPTVL